MSDETTKLTLDLSSIINLKAELVKKQEEFRLKKISKSLDRDEYESHKTLSTWGKKRKIESKDQTEPASKNVEKVENVEEIQESLLDKSRKMLESKAKFYDEVISGRKMTDEGDEEIFLVDFDKKAYDETKSKLDEDSEFKTEKIRFKNEIDEDEFNKELRLKWEKEQIENLDKDKVHYQDIRFNEVRNMGVGNYQFSRDEEERKKQMEFFKSIEIESKTTRITNEVYKLKREKLLVERLSKVKQRRLLKFGYSIEKIKEMCTEFEKEIEDIERDISELEKVLANPELFERKETETDEFKPVKKVILDREWDKPKLKEKMWVKHVEKLRTERNKQFAPPKLYDPNKSKGQNGKQKGKKNKSKPEIKKEQKQERAFEETYQKAPQPPEFYSTGFNIPAPMPPQMFFYPPPPMMFPFPPPFPPMAQSNTNQFAYDLGSSTSAQSKN